MNNSSGRLAPIKIENSNGAAKVESMLLRSRTENENVILNAFEEVVRMCLSRNSMLARRYIEYFCGESASGTVFSSREGFDAYFNVIRVEGSATYYISQDYRGDVPLERVLGDLFKYLAGSPEGEENVLFVIDNAESNKLFSVRDKRDGGFEFRLISIFPKSFLVGKSLKEKVDNFMSFLIALFFNYKEKPFSNEQEMKDYVKTYRMLIANLGGLFEMWVDGVKDMKFTTPEMKSVILGESLNLGE